MEQINISNFVESFKKDFTNCPFCITANDMQKVYSDIDQITQDYFVKQNDGVNFIIISDKENIKVISELSLKYGGFEFQDYHDNDSNDLSYYQIHIFN